MPSNSSASTPRRNRQHSNTNDDFPNNSTLPVRHKSGRTAYTLPAMQSSSEPKLKKIRKGTKSCIECRQRKIRCIWSEGSSSCQNCETRGRPCVSQTYSAASTDAIRLTSRERIGQLENVVQNLCASLQRIETKLSIEGDDTTRPSMLHRMDSNTAGPSDYIDSESEDGEESDLGSVQPPDHLVQLFDSSLLSQTMPPEFVHTPSSHSPQADASFAHHRKQLQRLLPSSREVKAMEPHILLWINMLKHIFPSSLIFGTGMDMAAHYDEMVTRDVHPTKLANYLLPIAICVLHVPPDTIRREMSSIRDPTIYVKQVSDAVERAVFNDDAMLGTLEGLEVGLMYLRLTALRARVRKVWIGLRRVISIAEMVGLPRAAARFGDQLGQWPLDHHIGQDVMSVETRQHAAKFLWECILAVDRIQSLMFGLPMGTMAHKWEVPETIMLNGMVHLPAVLAYLASAAVKILEIDTMHAARRPADEIVEQVMLADQELRTLVTKTPPTWWKSPPLSADALVIFWYQYSAVRAHVQLALRNDENNRFAYSYMRCLEACRALAKHYVQVRQALPPAFFAGRLLDLQALTPAIFLLHTHYKPQILPAAMQVNTSNESAAGLVRGILECAESLADKPGGDFAKTVAKAIRSVIELLEAANKGEARVLTIKVPLLGQIQVGRQRSSRGDSNYAPGVMRANTLTAEDFEMANSLDWVMEINDDFPFLPDQAGSDLLSLNDFESMT